MSNPKGKNQYTKKKRPWFRVRFKTDSEDFRPVQFPPPGPYWRSGSGDGHSILVAYVRNVAQIEHYWPEGYDLESEKVDEIVFSERFPKPEWWKE